MKMPRTVVLLLAGGVTVALVSGCADREPPLPPPDPAMVGDYPAYPDEYFWDGDEYAAWFGDRFYYWAPGGVWILCDPVRVQRINVWVKAHPEWRPLSAPQTGAPPATNGPQSPTPVQHPIQPRPHPPTNAVATPPPSSPGPGGSKPNSGKHKGQGQ